MEMAYAQAITCLSAINSFHSCKYKTLINTVILNSVWLNIHFSKLEDLVITAGSDKSIEIFDMNECKSCLFIPEAHTRNIHQIYQNESIFNQNSYDLVLTNAIADGIKLWDLRIAQ